MNVHIQNMSEDDLEKMIEEHRRLNPDLEVKRDVIEALDRYVNMGIPPGGFLTAVLCNDLMGAFSKADSYNRASLYQICQYIYNELPIHSHGSPEKVGQWLGQFTESMF